MPVEKIERRNCVPIVYVKGTHYEVGFDVGRTFKSMILSYLETHGPLNKDFLPVYETPEGKAAYESTLAVVKENYPQYLEEMQGTADGAEIPFYKLFLLHMDEILPAAVKRNTDKYCNGCSTVCSNYPGQEFIGHNEDALAETLGHFYFVSAHIIAPEPRGRWKVKEEKFTSLCYAGHLPGFTMSYNQFGFIYTVNLIRGKFLLSGRTPRMFLTRALLAARNLVDAKEILTDAGVGIGDGLSVNMIFLNEKGDRVFYNAEAGPADNSHKVSLLNIMAINSGQHFYHCNRYLRLACPEDDGPLISSSKHREAAMNSHPSPKSLKDVANILGDESDREFQVYRRRNGLIVKTIATGLFDLNNLTWTIYTNNPKKNEPVLELPLLF